MIRLTDVSLYRGDKLLFEAATVTIHPQQKVGISGHNGCGKSSLLALLRRELLPQSGEVELPPSWQVATVKQETPALDYRALDYVLQGDRELSQLQRQLQQAEQQNRGEAIAALHAQLEAIGGYSATTRAEKLLAGLGFSPAMMQQPVATLSGGWRVRLNLAQALFQPFDLLLLDEPTNHLDLDATLWLQQWLQRLDRTVVLISHDRDVLDGVVGQIIHFEQQTLRLYRGNYSDFEQQRAEQQRLQQLAYSRQQQQRQRLQRYIDRFRASATRATQAQSRIKQLQRMEQLLPAYADSPFQFSFADPDKLPSPLLQLREAKIGYVAAEPLVSVAQLVINPGDRLALLGKNGCGKSTLLQALAGGKTLLQGEYQTAADCAIGYFAQHQLQQLDVAATPLRHLQRLAPRVDELRLRNFLGGFGFSGEMALTEVERFSGGERSRLVLAMLVWQRPNLLLLDEPTNHLDLDMRQALSWALQQFEGAMVVVSHDRHLLRSVVDVYYSIEGGRVCQFDGTLAEYERQLWQKTGKEASSDGESRRQQRQQAAQKRQQRQPLTKALLQTEKELAKWQRQLTQLHHALSDATLYEGESRTRLLPLLAEEGEIKQQLEQLELRWLEQSEALEQLDE
ncbi:ATP-binding cassette domain-containing protein [Ectothiorhodospiraceae bacterium BW-2]|nr:ATP-binding cassette domain-containing protein [Ectothiorhodospiraceae bacterium BW-2]